MNTKRGKTIKIAASINNFTTKFYQALLSKKASENLVISPFSLHTALATVGLGSRGITRSEILNGLKIEENDNDIIAKSYHSIITSYQDKSNPTPFILLTANKIYSQTGYGSNSTYDDFLQTYFQSDLEQVDFSTPEEATNTINGWVEEATWNQIKNFVKTDYFNPPTRLVIVNAIYFNCAWEFPFNSNATRISKFHVSESRQVDVSMMAINTHFRYAKLPELDCEVIVLPYKGCRLGLVIFLPLSITGLSKIQDNIGSVLNEEKCSLLRDELNCYQLMDVQLPKFRIEADTVDLIEILKKLGMKEMFTPSADFSTISDQPVPDLYVTKVLQKTFIEINEEGTGAADAAFCILEAEGVSCKKPTPIPFNVDRPFYFQLVDHANKDLVLFSGHCIDPTV